MRCSSTMAPNRVETSAKNGILRMTASSCRASKSAASRNVTPKCRGYRLGRLFRRRPLGEVADQLVAEEVER